MTSIALLAVAITSLPFTYCGRLVDWNHRAYSTGSDVEIRVRNAAGELVCKTTTFAAGPGSPVNYRAEVPIATSATSGYAQTGERVTFEVTVDGVDYSGSIPSSALQVGASGDSVRIDLMLAKDENGNGIADEYEEYYAYRMGGTYDPNGDPDGDGMSNFGEYVAGTSPVNAADCLRINRFGRQTDAGGDYFTFDLVTAPGRIYTVGESPVCRKDAAWTLLRFRTARDGQDVLRYPAGDNAELKTFFVPADGSKPADFFRLGVE